MGSEQELSKFGEITYAEKQRQKDALYVPLPVWLNEKTVSLLSDSGINLLYRHQREALEAAFNNDNVVISTGTSSGKSLCYQIPLIEMLLADDKATAVMIFPTKALTQDQHRSLTGLFPEKADKIAIYDGDTPKQLRSHSVFGKILSLPTLVWKMVLNILKIDRKNTDFIHTTHDK